MEEQQTVLIVCTLKSTIEKQITEAMRMGISVASAANCSDKELHTVDFQRANAQQHSTCCVSLFFILVLPFDFRQVLIGLNMTVDNLPGLRGTCGRKSRFPEMRAGFPSSFAVLRPPLKKKLETYKAVAYRANLHF